MVGLTCIEVHNSIFNITEEQTKLKFFLFPQSMNGSIAFVNVRDDIGKHMENSGITTTALQDEI